MKIKLLLLFIVNSFCIYAQNFDSIYNEIAKQPETKITLSIKSRNYVSEQIKGNNYSNVLNLLSFYSQKYYTISDFLSETEELLIYFWAGQYDYLLSLQNDYKRSKDNNGFYFRSFDFGITKYFYSNSDALYTKIELSNRTEVEKEFLKLYLNSLLLRIKYSQFEQEELNNKSNEFVKKYNSSIYIDFVKNEIRSQWRKSIFSFEAAVFLGTRYFTKPLNQYFSQRMSLGLDCNINIWRFRNNFGIAGSNGKVLETFEFNNVIWTDNQAVDNNFYYFVLGFDIAKGKRLTISPYYSTQWLTIVQNLKDNSDLPKIHTGVNQIMGVNFFWKFNDSFRDVNSPWFSPIPEEPILRLNIGYGYPLKNTNLDSRFKNYNTFTCEIGVGILIQPRVKVKK